MQGCPRVYNGRMRKSAFLVLLLAVLLVGCKGNNFIGKWNVTGLQMPVPGATMTMEFTSTDAILQVDIPSVNVKQKIVGTYKVEGDTMTTNFNDIVIEGEGPQIEMAKKAVDAMKPQVLQQLNKDPNTTIKWDGKDKFTASSANSKSEVTFTRIP